VKRNVTIPVGSEISTSGTKQNLPNQANGFCSPGRSAPPTCSGSIEPSLHQGPRMPTRPGSPRTGGGPTRHAADWAAKQQRQSGPMRIGRWR
jgi:hypothetical protein